MTPVSAPRELVLASAGSGKTYWISSRLIGLLAAGEDPDRILAATFTRKAAGQILDRVLARLAAGALDVDQAQLLARETAIGGVPIGNRGPEFWASILERTVDRLHRFSVGTLDSFFIRAASSFPFELGLSPGWRIPDLPTFRRMKSRALLAVLRDVERPAMLELLRLSARGDPRRSVHDHLAGIMDQLAAIAEHIDPAAEDPWGALRRATEGEGDAEDPELLALALEAASLPLTRAGTPVRDWVTALRDVASAVRKGEWEGVARLTICERVAARELTYSGQAIGGATLDLLERVLATARSGMRRRLADQIEALGTLTGEYVKRYRALQRGEGLYSFSDVTRLMGEGDSLGSRADLYYRLDARTRHVLLDEFQDTSLAQWEALEPIVDEVLSDDGRAAVIVADPKQSIYGWRGAEPGIVRAIWSRYGLTEETLTTSYRSSPVILDFVNRVFGSLGSNPALADDPASLGVASSWVRDFRVHEAKKLDLQGYVAIEVGPPDEGRGGPRPNLSRFAAGRAAEISRELGPGFTIGVLTRTNDAVGRLYLELRELGIEVSQEGGTPLTDSAACEAVLALFRLADHPADTIARYHVASSPLGEVVGLTDFSDTRAAESVATGLRDALLSSGYGRTVVDLAERIAPSCDRRDARRLSQLAELAYTFEAGATLRPADFVRRVETERVEDRVTADVRVMTVHQAKGLEFDVVILPQLDEPILGSGRPVAALPYRESSPGRVTSVFPAGSRALRSLFPELDPPYQQSQETILRDALSTLYVGLTRPRYALHAVIAPDARSGPTRALTSARILREGLTGTGIPMAPALESTVLYEQGRPDWHRHPAAIPEREEKPGVRGDGGKPIQLRAGPRGRLFRRESPSQLHAGPINLNELLRLDRSNARDRGALVHSLFEKVEWVDDLRIEEATWLEDARRSAPNLPDSVLRDTLIDFRRWIASPAVATAMSRARYGAGAVVERERPFIRRHGGALMEGVIDRVVISCGPEGPIAAEIFDFKTDRSRGGDDDLSRADRYRQQLSAYVDAVAELHDLPRERVTASLIVLDDRGASVQPIIFRT